MRADLPSSRFATEEEQVYYAVKFGSGDLNPHYFLHPPFFAYILFGIYGATFVVGRLAGWFHGTADFERLFFTDPTLFFLIARTFVLLLALGGLLIFYRLAKRLYRRESVALLATGFLSASTLHVIAAHYANTDIPMMVLALLAFLMIVQVLREGTLTQYALAGLCIGLATATKYNAAWLGVALMLAHVIRGLQARSPWGPLITSRKLWLGLALVGLGFLMGCPFALVDFQTFFASFQKLRWELMTLDYHFASYRAQGHGPLFLLTSVFPSMVGVPLTVICILVLLYALWRRQPEDLLLAGFFMTFAAYLGSWNIIKPRYFIYVLPMILLLAARWCVVLADRLRSSRLRTAVLLAAWAALVVAPWQDTIQFDRLVAQTPAPVKARAWVEAHVPSGTGIATFAGIPLMPNEISIQRQLEEASAKRIGKGLRLQRLSHYVASMPATYDIWQLPFPWREDYDETDFDFAKHRLEGVRYFLVTDEVEHYLAEPSRFRVQVAYYDAIRSTCQLVQSFRQRRPMVDPGLGDEEYVLVYKLRNG